MALRRQLLNCGFVGGDCRLDILVDFLQLQEVVQLEDLICCPTLVGFTGADKLHEHELMFVQEVCLCVLHCLCTLSLDCNCLGGCFHRSKIVASSYEAKESAASVFGATTVGS